mgnify:CR=1 FL=1
MKRLFNLKSALWAGLMLFGVVAFTGCSKNDDNNDNGKNNGGFHVDEKLSELHMPVGEWAATTNGSYAIVRNPDTKKTYKVKFRVNAKDGRWIPIDSNTGKDFNLLQNLNYNATDLGDKEHHFYILDRSNIMLLKKDAEGDWILDSKGVFSLFHKSATKDSANPPLTNVLTDSISQIVSACPGEIGVAVIVNNRDTVKVNNKSVYPMMSVFKVHQALALCNDFDNKGISLDTLVNINRDKLDPKTWSPMLKDYSGPVISLTVRDLLRYTLTQSDNNASNLMFKDMVNVAQTDSFIATLIPRSSFQIAYTEEEMSADHNKAYSNYTSPLGAAMLMNRLFTEGLIDDEKQSFIKNTLKECKTGVDRIAAPLLDKEGVVIAHKTGSGYVNENGVLAAHNDVAYICLPNNISYTLAVFVKDFKGNESQASQYVAHISAVVYSLLMQTSVKS